MEGVSWQQPCSEFAVGLYDFDDYGDYYYDDDYDDDTVVCYHENIT